MANGQQIIPDRFFGEDLLVAHLRLLRFREVAGKMAADQPVTRQTGHEFSRLVHIRNFAGQTDGDQRVETGLKQTARIKGCRAQAFPRPFSSGDG